MTPGELLDKTSEVLHQRGWTQLALVDETGSLCLVGALRTAAGLGLCFEFATGDRAAYNAACSQLRTCAREIMNVPTLELVEYNDEVATSIEDVDKVIQCAKTKVAP